MDDVVAAKDLHWKGVEEVKKIIQDNTLKPAGWEYMLVERVDPIPIEPPIPAVLFEGIQILIAFNWSPS